jgi:hypothetical protein
VRQDKSISRLERSKASAGLASAGAGVWVRSGVANHRATPDSLKALSRNVAPIRQSYAAENLAAIDNERELCLAAALVPDGEREGSLVKRDALSVAGQAEQELSC